MIGVNSRLDAIQAAVLDVKLKKLDEYNRARARAAAYYNEKFKDIDDLITPVESKKSTHVYHQYTLKVLNQHRDLLKVHLDAQEIANAIYLSGCTA